MQCLLAVWKNITNLMYLQLFAQLESFNKSRNTRNIPNGYIVVENVHILILDRSMHINRGGNILLYGYMRNEFCK